MNNTDKQSKPNFKISTSEDGWATTFTPLHEPLTKRERFAMAAMQGRLSRSAEHDSKNTAKEAVQDADALLNELNKEES